MLVGPGIELDDDPFAPEAFLRPEIRLVHRQPVENAAPTLAVSVVGRRTEDARDEVGEGGLAAAPRSSDGAAGSFAR